MKFFLLILKNLRRNKLRTVITCLAVMVLVLVVTMIWTVLYFLDNLTKEKGGNLKAIVTDRYDMQGQLPLSYAGPLSQGAARKPGDKVPVDSMSWQVYLGTLDLEKRTRENLVVLIAMDARQLPTKVGKLVTHKGMIDDLNPVDKKLVDRLAETANGCLLGRKRLKTLNKRVGERFKVSGSQPAGVNLEFEIVGVLPLGRWDENGFMNARYLNAAIDTFCRDHPASKPVRAYATARYEHGVDVAVNGLLWFADGRTAAFDCGFTLPQRSWLEITGTRGVVRVPAMWVPPRRATFEIRREGKRGVDEVLVEGHDQIQQMLENFGRYVHEGKEVSPAPEEAVKTLKVLDALGRSAREKGEVDVAW
jgi:hypothetical protein